MPRSPGNPSVELLLVIATAAAIIVLPIEQGVAIGITLSLLHGIFSTTRARVTVYERVPGTSIWWPSNPHICPAKPSPMSWSPASRRHCRFSTPIISGAT